MANKNKTQKKYNHRQHYLNRIPMKVRDIRPGTLVEFTYSGDDIFDHRPLVLVLANGYYDKRVNSDKNILIHGLNFNYLPRFEIIKLREWLQQKVIRGETYSVETKERDDKGKFIKGEQRYTELTLPHLQEQTTTGQTLGVAQIRTIITTIYSQVLKPRLLAKNDAYRKYNVVDITNIRAILYKFK